MVHSTHTLESLIHGHLHKDDTHKHITQMCELLVKPKFKQNALLSPFFLHLGIIQQQKLQNCHFKHYV